MIQVNGMPLEWREGMTVRDVLTARNFKFPLLIISVNDEAVDAKAYDFTAVPDGAEVKVIHLLSGG